MARSLSPEMMIYRRLQDKAANAMSNTLRKRVNSVKSGGTWLSIIFTVLPRLAWVKIQAAAQEADSGIVVFGVPITASTSLDRHDFAV